MAFDFDDWNKAIERERMKREEKKYYSLISIKLLPSWKQNNSICFLKYGFQLGNMILYLSMQEIFRQKIENTMNMQMITETEEILFGEKRKYIDFL